MISVQFNHNTIWRIPPQITPYLFHRFHLTQGNHLHPVIRSENKLKLEKINSAMIHFYNGSETPPPTYPHNPFISNISHQNSGSVIIRLFVATCWPVFRIIWIHSSIHRFYLNQGKHLHPVIRSENKLKIEKINSATIHFSMDRKPPPLNPPP